MDVVSIGKIFFDKIVENSVGLMNPINNIRILLVMMFALNVSAFAVVDSAGGKGEISLQEAMDLALKGNIELQEQRKILEFLKIILN